MPKQVKIVEPGFPHMEEGNKSAREQRNTGTRKQENKGIRE